MILLIGGLGNDFVYFQYILRGITKTEPIRFYEFNNSSHHIHLQNWILQHLDPPERSEQSHTVTIIAYSMSCPVVVETLNNLYVDPFSYVLHLVEPPNIGECPYAPESTSYHPLRKEKVKTHGNNDFDMVFRYPNWIWNLLSIQPIRYIVLNLIDLFTPIKQKTPYCVDDTIIKMGQHSVKQMIEQYAFPYSPFMYAKKIKNIVNVYSGTESKYHAYAQLLCTTSPLFKLHVVQDANHHFLHFPSTSKSSCHLDPRLATVLSAKT